ncbi:MAG: hypothetical protein JNM56_17015 [Planctomycetia bacterium]|nr:hypothetical protein [Planctomycetia bacterium]
MNPVIRDQLLAALEAVGDRYPQWRFGQQVSNIAGWTGEPEWTDVSDDLLLTTAREHLERRLGEPRAPVNGLAASESAQRGPLLQILASLGRTYPDWSLCQLIARLAALAHVNVYDVEDEQLIGIAESNDPGPQWFWWYLEKYERASTHAKPQTGVAYCCPCCQYRTLDERGGFDICPVCYWEDDGQDDADADTVRGGPNGALSLTAARTNYRRFGVCDQKYAEHVRPPRLCEQ